MCGITGVVNIGNSEPVSPRKLQLANDTIRHRGPDDEGIYVEPDFGMAMRRLSIIDIQGGHQPIHSPCGRYHICYNGEIYNYLELKRELISLGHNFHTHSDTEVVLHAFMRWGPEASIKKLRGMYAYCIWDSLSKSLFLVRDRMGIKPLYYLENEGRLYFASEIRGLLLHSNITRQIDLKALDAFMTIGFVPSPDTLFQGVRKLPPAHYLSVHDNHISIHNYWDLDFEVDSTVSEGDAIEQFRELITESVGIHLMSEVPLGALLSGGIDSTTTTALMQKAAPSPVKTICIGFSENYYDESDISAASAKFFGTNHESVIFRGTTLDEYPIALFHREEPTADAVFVAAHYLFKGCRRRGLKVVLTGEGADELLGGYDWHRWEQWVAPFLKIPFAMRTLCAQMLTSLIKRHQGIDRMAGAVNHNATDIVKRYIDYIKVGNADVKEGLFSSDVKATLNDDPHPSLLQSWETLLTPVRNQPAGSQLLWLQSRTRLADWSNIGVDRLSMAHSVEARVPFLDHRLWEYCATLPHRFKLGGSYIKPVEKTLLRNAVRNQIPEAVRVRRKKGLMVPHSSWLAKERLPDWAEQMLSEEQIKKMNVFDPIAARKLRTAHRAGADGMASFLMGVLAIQTWGHIFMDGPLDSGAPVML